MKRFGYGAAGAVAVMLAGCAPMAAEPEQPVPVAGAGECDATKAQGLIGQQATGDLGAEAMRLTGARSLRWIQPGTAVTMDYRTDRLNIHMNEQNRVTEIGCG